MKAFIPPLVASGLLAGAALAAHGQPLSADLIQQMEGTWAVQQRTWPAAGAAPKELPPASATRKRVGSSTIEETMTLAAGTSGDPFTRLSVLNYNDVTRRFEYYSIDTRAPQQMTYQGGPPAADLVKLQGGRYFAPEWGQAKDVSFRYRVEVGKVVGDAQRVALYLTPLSGLEPRGKEFVAFEYRYTRAK